MSENQIENSMPGSRLVIQGDEIPFGAYQAIYHKLTRKVEKRRKVYNGAYTIEVVDLQNLNERLKQVIKQYQVKSSSCSVTHSFKELTSRDHTSFEHFRMADVATTCCTKAINYELDFLVVLPPEVEEASDIAQRYVINIRLDQDFYENPEPIPAIFRDIIVTGQNLVATIEYPDYAVSEALSATIDGWESGLRKRSQSRIVDLLFKHETDTKTVFPRLAACALLLFGAWSVYNAVSVRQALTIILLAPALAYLSQPITSFGINTFFRLLTYFRSWTYILVTSGDVRRHESLTKENGIGIFGPILAFLGIFNSLVLGVLGNYIYDTLK